MLLRSQPQFLLSKVVFLVFILRIPFHDVRLLSEIRFKSGVLMYFERSTMNTNVSMVLAIVIAMFCTDAYGGSGGAIRGSLKGVKSRNIYGVSGLPAVFRGRWNPYGHRRTGSIFHDQSWTYPRSYSQSSNTTKPVDPAGKQYYHYSISEIIGKAPTVPSYYSKGEAGE